MEENWQERDVRRSKVVKEAVQAADEVIMEGTDHSVEETNYLTAQVAKKFTEKALRPFEQDIQAKDIKKDTQGEEATE